MSDETKNRVRVEVLDFEDCKQGLFIPSAVLQDIKLTGKLGSGSSSTVYGGTSEKYGEVAVKFLTSAGEEKTTQRFGELGIGPTFHFSDTCTAEWESADAYGPSGTSEPFTWTIIVTARCQHTLKTVSTMDVFPKLAPQIAEQLEHHFQTMVKAGLTYADWSPTNIMLNLPTEKTSLQVYLVDFEDAGEGNPLHEEAFQVWMSELKKGKLVSFV